VIRQQTSKSSTANRTTAFAILGKDEKMSGKKYQIIISLLLLLLSHGTVLVAELVIPPGASAILSRELARNMNTYPLNQNDAQEIGDRFAHWVSQSMDFDLATKRMSTQFAGRETFYEELAENIPIFMFGRGVKGLTSDMSVPIIYRRSAGRYSFRKLLDVEAETTVADDVAMEMAITFLNELGIVTQTELDTFGEITYPKLIQLDPPDDDEGPDTESVILQQVRFKRLFGGRPVLNSRISVDFHPDTLEVLGFKHYNWSMVHERSASPVPRGDVKTRSQVEETLRLAAAEYWTPEQVATLTQIIPGWYQTETGLIPTLAFEIKREETGSGDVLSALVNVAGSDEVFQATSRFTPSPVYGDDCFPSTNSDYKDWISLGLPSCWCAPYQCYGDADGKTQGFQNYRIMTNDLALVIASWKATDEDIENPCTDFDHATQGFQDYRVMTNDLAILIENWKKTDRELPGDCPKTR